MNKHKSSTITNAACVTLRVSSTCIIVDESLLQPIPEVIDKTRKIKSPVHIKGVGDEMYLSQESMVLDVFLPDVTNSRLTKINSRISHRASYGMWIAHWK